MAGFPIRVEVLSRFRSEEQQREIAAGIRSGEIDIAIGTHRLLQKDIEFKDLGLVVVDEEHAGVPSYTTELGQGGARALLVATYVLLWASLSGLAYALRVSEPWPPVLGLLSVLPGLLTVAGPAKRIEAGASFALLVSFVVCGGAAWSAS